MRISSHMRLVLTGVVWCAFAVVALADRIADIHPRNYLTDLAGVVDTSTADRINALCAEVEKKTGAQIAVVTVHSLDGQPIENYAVDLFKHLGVGRKDNRGILLLVAPNDRRYRFEVGYGLEPVINDARAGDVGREMVPLLRQNDYSGALALGAGRVAGLIAADAHVTLEQGGQPPAPAEGEPIRFPVWVFP